MGYDWREITGWFTEDEAAALTKAAKLVPVGQCIVEVGSYCGRSAVVLAQAAQEGVPVYCIDRWEGVPEDVFQVGCSDRMGWVDRGHGHLGLPHPPNRMSHHIGLSAQEFEHTMKAFGYLFTKIFPIVGDFGKVAERMAFPPIGLLFLDADHSQAETARAFRVYKPKLSRGATVFFHDYQAFPDVAKAIQELGLKVVVQQNLAMWKAE